MIMTNKLSYKTRQANVLKKNCDAVLRCFFFKLMWRIVKKINQAGESYIAETGEMRSV